MFSFFKKKFSSPPPASVSPAPTEVPTAERAPAEPVTAAPAVAPASAPSSPSPLPSGGLIGSALVIPIDIPEPAAVPPERQKWLDKLKAGLGKTASNISNVFTGQVIDEDLYEDLEAALLQADAGVAATEYVLKTLRDKVKATGVTHPVALKNILIATLTDLLTPLQKQLVIGQHTPTVVMVAGVNGAGKTTSIGKLTKHLIDHDAKVLLAAADTFRAAAREQLTVWADRNTVEIVSHDGGDPAAVSFDAVNAGKARGKDVVLIDTAGRLPTQLHLMEELKKIKRVIQKADTTAPHEVLLVIDGNTGQNAVTQVKAFDDALGLTGLIVTKLDGTAKGGVLAAIARERPIPVYFIGVGEKLDELETFNAREFAQALVV
ncbi:signal recognition particle-docking protein FtsY [Curvibacter sp. APW13]|uniref:signal recognition particle-docking protein FtsY n=1 Tax=Curvibacter sp. APW13 TaxID=3077236 RepID=UPI0028DD4216|nr:signal recognition particle-docking protein FtsY [Curvibacter sp. APW13]MDT8992475.1 signal recognition particle-docking protein FtsY [Curvibacter sp. APW13]